MQSHISSDQGLVSIELIRLIIMTPRILIEVERTKALTAGLLDEGRTLVEAVALRLIPRWPRWPGYPREARLEERLIGVEAEVLQPPCLRFLTSRIPWILHSLILSFLIFLVIGILGFPFLF